MTAESHPAGRTLLVIGATSRIAREICHVFAKPGTSFILAARSAEDLERCAEDLRIRHGCEVSSHTFDALEFSQHAQWVDDWCDAAGGAPDGVVVCHGYLPGREAAVTDSNEARRTLDINLGSVVSLLTPLAERMASRGSGWIVGVSSVAGDRGRQSNYVYGSAKAGLNSYLQGLRNRLGSRGVHVMTVKPGFVDTPMLRSQKSGSSILIAKPQRVARDIERAVRRRRNVIYTPGYWWIIMTVIRAIPEPIFKRMKL